MTALTRQLFYYIPNIVEDHFTS